MSDSPIPAPDAITRFYDNYLKCLDKASIPENQRRWSDAFFCVRLIYLSGQVYCGRELLLRFWRAKTLNQPLYLLSATATSRCGIGLFFNLFHCCRPIYDGIDNIHLDNLITDT